MNINDIQVGCKYIWDGTVGANGPKADQLVTVIQRLPFGCKLDCEGRMSGAAVRSFPKVGPEDFGVEIQTASGEIELVKGCSLQPQEEPSPEPTS